MRTSRSGLRLNRCAAETAARPTHAHICSNISLVAHNWFVPFWAFMNETADFMCMLMVLSSRSYNARKNCLLTLPRFTILNQRRTKYEQPFRARAHLRRKCARACCRKSNIHRTLRASCIIVVHARAFASNLPANYRCNC